MAGSLAPDDPVFEGTELRLAGPVEVGGRLRRADGDNLVWQGTLRTGIIGECRRCLGEVEQRVDDELTLLFSADEELLEDPSVYPLPADASSIDLAEAVREELVLRAAAFPLCKEDCKGICPVCGADLNAGPCSCAVSGTNH